MDGWAGGRAESYKRLLALPLSPRGANVILTISACLSLALQVSHRHRAQKKSVWNDKRQDWSPKEFREKSGQSLSDVQPAQAPRPGGGGKALQTLGLSGPSRAGRNGPSAATARTRLLQKALGARRVDKALMGADKRHLCSQVLGSCHPAAPWGGTCGVWMFVTQRPGEKNSHSTSNRLSTMSPLLPASF